MTAFALASRQQRSVTVAPASINDDARTVEVIASTGAERVALDSNGRPYVEALEISAAAIDLTAFVGASVLNTHQQFDLSSVLGVVRDAWIEGANLMATLHIDDDALWGRIKSGVIRNVSVGYQVDHATLTEREGQHPLVTVTRWRPCEISFVPVPADPGAHTRKEAPAMPGATTTVVQPTITAPAPVQTRAQINATIRSAATSYGLNADFANGLIDNESTVEQATQAIQAEAARQQAAQTASVAAGAGARSFDPSPAASAQARAEAMGEALYARRHASHQLSDQARAFAYMTTVDMARMSLEAAHVSSAGLSPNDLIQRSIGMHTTSDLVNALANFTNRELRTGYTVTEEGIRQVARETTARDFRKKSKVLLETDAGLERVNESGEIKHGKLLDSAETYKIDTFGKIVSISRQALVNDDLDAVGDLARKLGEEAGAFESRFLVKTLEGANGLGPKLSDGKALFHADHGNLATTGAGLSEASLSAGRLAMRRQKKLNGEIIGIAPKFLVVPPELETAGEKIIAAIMAVNSDDVNAFAGKLTLVVEPRLTSATRWYVAADPAAVEGLEYSYLQGAPGPQTRTEEPFGQDGVSVRVLLDFGAGFVDHRGWYANPGQ